MSTAPPCSPAELAALRRPLTSGGYLGVYAHRSRGGTVGYVAKPTKRLRLGSHPTPRLAAAAVAAWWRDRLGPDWADRFGDRRHPGWAAVPLPAGPPPRLTVAYDLAARDWVYARRPGGAYAAPGPAVVWTLAPGGGWVGRRGRGGYAAVAYPLGAAVRVGLSWDRRAALRTAADAKAAVRWWAGRQGGLFASRLLAPPGFPRRAA